MLLGGVAMLDNPSGQEPGALGSQFWAADCEWPVVAAADLHFHSWRIAAHRVQHVVPVEPRQNRGIGLRPLDFCHVYLISGLSASLASLIWNPVILSVGASGAIFGIAGALIASFYLGEFSMPRPR